MDAWSEDAEASAVARAVWPEDCPRVMQADGGQYVIGPTKLGRIALTRVSCGGFVAAVERLPPGDPSDGELRQLIPLRLKRYHRKNRLLPWRYVRADDVADAIRELGSGRPAALPTRRKPASPFLCPLGAAPEVVGDARRKLVERLACVLSARRPRDPAALLAGPTGLGRRTAAVAAARAAGMEAVELPLARILPGRPNGTAVFLEVVAAVAGELGGDLLVVSGAELIGRVGAGGYLLEELARLPAVVLLASSADHRLGGVIPMSLPGLVHAELGELLRTTWPDVEFSDTAVQALARGTSVPGAGIVAGRALFVARLSLRLLGADSDPVAAVTEDGVELVDAGGSRDARPPPVVGADEVLPAMRLLGNAWDGSDDGTDD